MSMSGRSLYEQFGTPSSSQRRNQGRRQFGEYSVVSSIRDELPERPEWINPETRKVSATSPAVVADKPFEPKYESLSARERKLRALYGADYTPPVLQARSDDIPTPVKVTHAVSAPTRVLEISSPLPSLHGTEGPKNVRRQASDLIAASLPWTTPLPQHLGSGVSRGDGETARLSNHRRQSNGLIPSTMPWSTSVVTCSANRKDDCAEPMDHRRRKVVDATDPSLQVAPSDTQISAPSSFGRKSNASTVSTFVISGISADGSEENNVRKYFSQNGVHLVRVKAVSDIVTHTSDGRVEILVRHDQPSSDVSGTISDLAVRNGWNSQGMV